MKHFTLLLAMIIIAGTVSAKTCNLNEGTAIDGKFIQKEDPAFVIEGERGNDYPILLALNEAASTADSSDSTSAQAQTVGTNEPLKTGGNSFKDVSIFINICSDYLISGKMYDSIHWGFSPTPESIGSISAGIGIDWYFLKYVGISLSYDYYAISVSFPKGYSSLLFGYGGTAKAMLIARIPFKPFINRDDRFMGLAVRFFAGPNFTTFDLSSDYKSLAEASASETIHWYTGPATGIGYIGGIGVLFEYNHFGCGLDIFAQNKTVKYTEAADNIDWFEIGCAFRISFDF